jgi:hypothetical protein
VARGSDKKPWCAPDRLASSTDAKTWLTFDAAVALAETAKLAGVGFVFSGDGITGVDLDHCRSPDGALEPWAQKWVDRLASYTEISPSGTGIHIFVRATLPGPGRKRKGDAGGALECYDRARYFTVTGEHLPGTPTTLEPRQEIVNDLYARLGAAEQKATTPAAAADNDHAILARAFDARNGAKTFALYHGRGEHASGSEADASLAAELAFWTRDAAQIERLMRGSKLQRDKWDERRPGGTWLSENVIAKALQLTEKTHHAMEAHRLDVRSFDTIAPEDVSWLWPGVVPYGKLTLFVGEPGFGKSLLTLDVAARLSAGAEMPDGTRPSPAASLLVFCEDGAGDTVRPRLEAAEAVLPRVHHVQVDGGEELLTLPDDLPQLGSVIIDKAARLVVFDPINVFLSSKTNSWRDADVRQAITPLARYAEEAACAVIGIMHLNKTMTANALQRVTGAGAFPAVARSVFLVGPHPEDKDLEAKDQRKVFAHVKGNLAPPPRSRVFRIRQSVNGQPVIAWEGETRHSATDMLGAQLTGVAPDGKVEEAVAAIRSLLAKGPRTAREMYELLKARGLSESTVDRARKAAGIVARQEASGSGGKRWSWRLPDELPLGEGPDAQDDDTPF